MREYLKKKKNVASKLAKRAINLVTKKDHIPMQNFLNEEKIHFFVRLYQYILLTNSGL